MAAVAVVTSSPVEEALSSGETAADKVGSDEYAEELTDVKDDSEETSRDSQSQDGEKFELGSQMDMDAPTDNDNSNDSSPTPSQSDDKPSSPMPSPSPEKIGDGGDCSDFEMEKIKDAVELDENSNPSQNADESDEASENANAKSPSISNKPSSPPSDALDSDSDGEFSSSVKTKRHIRALASSDEDDDLPDISQASIKDKIASSLFTESNEMRNTPSKNPVRLSTPPSSEDEALPANAEDSDSDLPDISENWLPTEGSEPTRKQKPRKQKTISEKKRKEQMKEIASKTQAMARERKVALPYHRPDQLTLEEFLKRRSAVKSSLLTTIKPIIKPGSKLSSVFKCDEQNQNPEVPETNTSTVVATKLQSRKYRLLPPSVTQFIPKLSAPNERGEIVFESDKKKKQVKYPPMPRLPPPKSPKKPKNAVEDKNKGKGKDENKDPSTSISNQNDNFILCLSDDEADKKSSGKDPVPGAKLYKLKETLKQHIRAKKSKEYEEKLKLHKQFLDEKKELEKAEGTDLLDDEEILDEEFSDFSSEEEDIDEEIELERLLSGRPRKERKKTEFVEDEAEDEDGNDDDDEEDEDEYDEDELEEIVEDDDEEAAVDVENSSVAKKKSKYAAFNDDDESQGPEVSSQDDLLSIHEDSNSNSIIPGAQPEKKGSQLDEDSQDSVSHLKPDSELFPSTPKICSSVLEQKTPKDFWIPVARKSSENVEENDNLGPLIPRLNIPSPTFANPLPKVLSSEVEMSSTPAPSSDAIDLLTKNTSQDLFVDSQIPPDSEADDADLVDLCSGQFLTGAPATPEETQVEGFNDEDELLDIPHEEAAEDPEIKTPGPPPVNLDVVIEDGLGETPKLSEKQPKVRLLDFRNVGKDKSAKGRLLFEEDSNSSATNDDKMEMPSPSMKKDDEDDDNESVFGFRSQKKKRKRLQLSDDEDEEATPAAEDDIEADSEDDDDDEEKDPVKTFEIFSKDFGKPVAKPKGLLTKDGKIRRKFVEAEAELSGSEEEVSEDEDERGLDILEEEDGDMESFSEEKLRTEVNKNYLKQLLDEDQRDIQYLQDVLLEDGDMAHLGEERERKFRWKNIDAEMLDDRAHLGDSDGEPDDEDEEEIKRKQEEIERTKWMTDNSQLLEDMEEESQKSFISNANFLKLGRTALKKINSFNETKSFSRFSSFNESTNNSNSSIGASSSSCALFRKTNSFISNSEGVEEVEETAAMLRQSVSQPFFASPDEPISKIKKGSFLSRGSPSLSRLAAMTKVNDSSVSNVKSNSRNFVFSVITPPGPNSDDSHSKKIKRPAARQTIQPKKVAKVDRSFSSLDNSKKNSSIFKYM